MASDPTQPARLNGYAVCGFLITLLPLGITGLLGLVFGVIGLRQTGLGADRGRGLAVAAVVLGALGTVLLVAALAGVGHIDFHIGSTDSSY